MLTFARLILLLWVAATSVIAPDPARAAWIPRGNPICTAPGNQSGAGLVPDGNGGAFVAWLDGRRGFPNSDLYATRILADGTIAPGWPVDGIALSQTGKVELPSLVSDGVGGLMSFWFDKSDYKPRMQHVDANGVLAPGFPANGMILPITVGGPSGYIVRACGDGAGGAYCMWNAFNGFSDQLLLTRFTGTGGFAAGWTATGVSQATADVFDPFRGFTSMTLAPDPIGGTLVTALWPVDGGVGPNYHVGRIVRTLANGTAGFTRALPYPPDAVGPLGAVPDSSGGAFIAYAAGSAPSPRMQHYLSNGDPDWTDPTAAPVSHQVIRDGAGGLYLFGRPPGADRLELHRRAGDASIPAAWTAAGLVLSTTGPYWAFAALRSGGLVFAGWSSGDPLGATDLRVSAVRPDGVLAPGWPAGGTSVVGLPTGEILTSLMPMPDDGALLAWHDYRSGTTNADVYVTLITRDGPATLEAPDQDPGAAALAFSRAGATPNPAREAVRFTFMLPAAGAATLELVDVAGRVCARREAEPRAGGQSLSLDTSGLAAGVYCARLRQAGRVAATRFAVIR